MTKKRENSELESSVRRIAFTAIAMAILCESVCADVDVWTNINGGPFNVGTNWQDGTAPDENDSALFSLANSYSVLWSPSVGNAVNKSLEIDDGNVTFEANGGTLKYTLDDPGVNAGDVMISKSTLTLGAISGANFTLEAKGTITLGDQGMLYAGFHSNITARDLYFDSPDSQLGSFFPSVSISDGATITVSGTIQAKSPAAIGIAGSGSKVETAQLFLDASTGFSSINVSQNASLVTTGYASIGGGNATFGGDGTACTWNAKDIGIGSGSLLVDSNSAVTADSIALGDNSVITLQGGSLTVKNLYLNNGGLALEAPVGAVPTSLGVTDPAGIVRLSAANLPSEGLSLGPKMLFSVAGTTILDVDAKLTINDPDAFDSSQLENNGHIVAAADVKFGDPVSPRNGAYRGNGQLDVLNNHSVTMYGVGYAQLGFLTQLYGGTINAANGVTVPIGGDLVCYNASCAVNGKVATAAGSTISAESGNFTLGDAGSSAGITIGGELWTNDHAVILRDANYVALGSLTVLGRNGVAGSLDASNGAIVDVADSIEGFGTISSSNNRQIIVNGRAYGNSAAQPLTFNTNVTGVGQFHNVTFNRQLALSSSNDPLSYGDITFSHTAELQISRSGAGFEELYSWGTVDLGGELSLILGSEPFTLGQSFEILYAANGIVNTFDVASYFPLSNGLKFEIMYSTHAVTLEVVAAIPGDYNQNGVVDAADYVVWRKNQGTTHTLPNDPTGGTIGAAQYSQWRAHFGQSAGSGTGATANAAVPEPATLVLVIFAMAGWCLGRSRPAWKVPATRLPVKGGNLQWVRIPAGQSAARAEVT